jgi:transglutaminase-like putative cysteine protease
VRYSGSLALADDASSASPTIATLRGLAPGAETRDTLKIMRQLALASLTDPAHTIRLLAISLTQGVQQRDWLGHVQALQRWVRDNIKFMRDPDQFELVQTPQKTIEIGAGDCDDKATLLAALLESIGHPAQFVAIGLDGGTFSHVLVRTKIGNTWVPAETIVPGAEVGWWPSGVTSHYILKV